MALDTLRFTWNIYENKGVTNKCGGCHDSLHVSATLFVNSNELPTWPSTFLVFVIAKFMTRLFIRLTPGDTSSRFRGRGISDDSLVQTSGSQQFRKW